MREFLKAVAFSALVILGAVACSEVLATDSRATVRKWDGPAGNCSVVVIAPERALTAAHCIKPLLARSTIEGRTATAVEYPLPGQDVALLTVPGLACPCAVLASAQPAIGDPIYSVGYPYGIDIPILSRGEYQGKWIFPDTGLTYGVGSQTIGPGASGGGVFDRRGRLVGINVLAPGSGTPVLFVFVVK